MKWTVYYRIRGGTTVNRDYPDYGARIGADQVKAAWQAANVATNRVYLQHEPHDEYTQAYAAAGMVGVDETTRRNWLAQRVQHLEQIRIAAEQAKQALLIQGTGGSTHVGKNPGDMTIDQNGRRGRVPNVPLEVFRTKPISPDTAMDAVRDFCKGGGGTIPRSS